jgi:acyl dehydratase
VSSNPSVPTFDAVSAGDELPARGYPVRRGDLVRYAGASGDFNPIHWNQRFARSVGLPDVIAHGMFTMATGARFLAEWCGDPGAVLEYGVRFTKPVVVPDGDTGTEVEISGRVSAVDSERRAVRVELAARCGEDRVLGRAIALVRLP